MEFDALIKKVADAGNELFWFGAASSQEIEKLETLLKLKLPPSYKEFLSKFGGGGVVESDISGIEENEASLDNGGTIYGDTLTCREDYELPESLVVIFFKDDEICWCLDTTENIEGEYPVVSYSLYKKKVDSRIATNFSEFFKQYLELRAE